MMIDDQHILIKIQEVLKEVTKDQKDKIDLQSINAETDVQLLDLDSLDLIGYRFNLDKAFNIEISDEDFEEKSLSVVKNLVSYIKNAE